MDINMKSTKLPIPQNPTVQNFSRPENKKKKNQHINQEKTKRAILLLFRKKNDFEGFT